MYQRKQYLNELISKKDNGRVKIITGLRRSGKSVLLLKLYRGWLLSQGIQKDQIVSLSLDVVANATYRDPVKLDRYIRSQMHDSTKRYYIFLDEIQFVSDIPNPYVNNPNARITFVDVVLGLMQMENVDVYITGSNSKMLSSDILTQFRDRGDEIRVYPLSYAEFYENYEGDKRDAWQEYYTYGGMPYVYSLKTREERSKYLKDLLERTYIKDVLERHSIKNSKEILDVLLDVLASSIGSLTNPNKLSHAFKSDRGIQINSDTIAKYLVYFEDSFLLSKALRYDVKGKKYINTPSKYYYTDLGLRNARLSFRQMEENHIMENILYNDLKRRGMDVDVGVVEYNTKDPQDKNVRKQLEVDFVVNQGEKRIYIQSALSVDDFKKREQEIASLLRIRDSFEKIVVVKDYRKPWRDDHGILYVGVEQFLLDNDIV